MHGWQKPDLFPRFIHFVIKITASAVTMPVAVHHGTWIPEIHCIDQKRIYISERMFHSPSDPQIHKFLFMFQKDFFLKTPLDKIRHCRAIEIQILLRNNQT